ncbi:glutamate receptor ionotropic, kainate 2-like [Tubulanus polymorphus]|uniref:glutamate receptor ionotropic, kainate 2-like n=1 Tax=Tubulanus polymorphus TaxID=672921 RepID=UPI003DA47DA3
MSSMAKMWRNICIGLLMVLLSVSVSAALQRVIKIGGIFEHHNVGQKKAFEYATDKINDRRDILKNTRLLAEIAQVPKDDSFHTSRKACHLLQSGMASVFGPMSSLSSAHVQSICDALEVPHIETRWSYRNFKDFYSVNLYPHYTSLSQAYVDIVKELKWEKFTILYEDNEGLIRLHSILEAKNPNNKKKKENGSSKYQITVRKLEAVNGQYKPLLKELKLRGETKIIVDCRVDKIRQVLREALQLEMLTFYYHYLFTTLDMGILDLNDFKDVGANITSYRIIDPQNSLVSDVSSDWMLEEMSGSFSPMEGKPTIKTETALIYDAVHLFATALDALSGALDITVTPQSCSAGTAWSQGSSLLNYLKMAEIKGLTGDIKFDSKGLRSHFRLQLVELTKKGILNEIGVWETGKGLNISKEYSTYRHELENSLKNKTLKITTILDDPFVMKSEPINGEPLKGNARFKGYCVDLLREIAADLGFNYTIELVADKKYGAKMDNGEWNGMVSDLIDKRADLAVASLTISYQREQVIDFTKPFMNLGISVIFMKPVKKNPSLFSFLSPLSIDVWIYMLAAYTIVSIILFVIARFTPYEWYNPHPCNPDSDVVENQFTILNSLWFTIGSLMQQGSEVAPRAISTRIVSGIWWFFTLIMISSYTANLAAFLTVERMISPIQSAEDLSKQTEIKYGTIWGGSTFSFFRSSKIPTYERMWNFMANEVPSVFVNTTKHGIERVKNGDYAYLLESTMNEYFTQRQCDLMQVGGLLDSKGYGIGTPMGSPYRDAISDSILKLQEAQKLHFLYNRWWKEKDGGGKCTNAEPKDANANELGVENVGGVFVVLVAGLFLSVIIAIMEFVWKARKNARAEKDSICTEMGKEFRFAIRCFSSSKKPAKKRPTQNDIMDNGMNLSVPLTGLVPSHTAVPGRELYA